MPQKLCNNDIILLCSDGLSGMIRDEEIESVIVNNLGNMTECVDALIKAALDAAGADNCTVALCQIISGGADSEMSRIPQYNTTNKSTDDGFSEKRRNGHLGLILGIVATLLAIIAIGGWLFWGQQKLLSPKDVTTPDTTAVNSARPDSTKANAIDDIQKEVPDEKGIKGDKENTGDKKNKSNVNKSSKKEKGGKQPSPTANKKKKTATPSKPAEESESKEISIGDGIYIILVEQQNSETNDAQKQEGNKENSSKEKKGGKSKTENKKTSK